MDYADLSREQLIERLQDADRLLERLRFVTDAAPPLIAYVDHNRRYRLVNRSYERWFKLPRERILGRTVRELVGDSVYCSVEGLITRTLAGNPGHFERKITFADGTVRDMALHFTPHMGGNGDVLGYCVIIEDISTRCLAEHALQQSEARFRTFSEAAFEGIALSEDGRILDCNEQLAHMLGYTLDELKGLPVEQLIAPESSRQVMERIHNHVDTRLEHEALRKDGSRITVEANGVQTDVAGSPQRITVIRDITRYKQAAKELQESERRFRTLFERAPLGVAIVDTEGRPTRVNAAMQEILGYTEAELLARSFLDISHPDDIEPTLELVRQLVDGRSDHQSLDKRYIRRDGSLIHANTHIAIIRDGQDRPLYFVSLLKDISDRVEAEARRLASIEQQRDVLVREVHHRIKNHLQGVVGLLRSQAHERPEIGTPMEQAIAQVQTIAQVYGLQSSGHTQVHLSDLLASLAGSCVAGVAIHCDIGSKTSPATLNQREAVPLALVINELLTNATKHLDQQGEEARVAVSLWSTAQEAMIRIVNAPAGLPAGFDFEDGQGLGTGLELVASLLPRHGAELSIRPLGRGVETLLRLTPPVLFEE